MKDFFAALWQGLLSGAQTRTRDEALQPQRYGFASNLLQAAYWFAFEVSNIVVYGARRSGKATR